VLHQRMQYVVGRRRLRTPLRRDDRVGRAGMLIKAAGHDGKPLDDDELERWTRVGYELGMRFRQGER
jgi:hypothetical protein